MPTVIGINQVPPNIPRSTFWDYTGQLGGSIADKILQAYLASQGGGGNMFGPKTSVTQPTQQYPGTFNFPPGSQSPGEAQQIAAMGGVPTQQGGQTLSRATQQPGTGVTFRPDQVNTQKLINDLKIQQMQSELQSAPYDLQAKQAEIAYKKSQAASMTPEFQANLLRQFQGLAPNGSASQSGGQEAAFTSTLRDLGQKAASGDEQAVNKIRLIKQLLESQ